MRVRCGACRSNVTISRPGRFSCPHCGAVNQVKGPGPGAGGPPPPPPGAPGPGGGFPGVEQPGPPPPPPEIPSPRISCTHCSFSFIVGQIQTAICPNCRAEVSVSGSF